MDALLALLHPVWWIVLAVCVAVAAVVGSWRLLQRGRSRMLSGMFAAVLLIATLVAVTYVIG